VKHNLKQLLHLTMARDFTVRAIRAWRKLLPDWTPTLDMLRDLDIRPHEHIAAVRIVATGWEANDPRWDVLMALLEYERREAIKECVSSCEEDAYLKALDESIQPLPSAPVCPPGECTWPDCGCPEIEQPPVRQVVIPFKVVNRAGQVFHSGETTVETPLKAAFLNNVRLVKHLREKNIDA